MNNWPQISADMSKSPTMCFACGRDNPIGLKLSFKWENKIAHAEFTPSNLHQGWDGIVHGGILSLLLDEAMSWAPHFEGITCVTAKMEVRLKRLTRVKETLVITSAITRRTRKLLVARADISLKDGTPVAEGTATMFVFDPNRKPDTEDRKSHGEK